jgi:hypothetical protein
LLICLATCLPGRVAGQQTVTVSQIPLALQDGSAHYVGPFNPQQMLRLVFALQPPHLDEEEQFLNQLRDPDSPLYHKYLSEAEWDARFAPSPEDEQAVVTWAQSQGLTITQRYPNRLIVDVEGPVAAIEKALTININSYQIGSDSSYFANDRAPSIPASLGNIIQCVLGLNNIEVAHSFSGVKEPDSFPVYTPGPDYAVGAHLVGDAPTKKPQAANKLTRQPADQYNPYTPAEIYSSYAYNYGALQGLGHCCNPLNNPNNSPPESSIAVAIWDDFAASDLQGFASSFGLAYNSQTIYVGGQGPCCYAEPTLDVEWSTAMANSFGSAGNTAKVYVYEGISGYFSVLLSVVNRALSDGYARVLNMSWQGAEGYDVPYSYMNSFHNVFNQMIGEGWSLVAASGDGGATTGCHPRLYVSYPASDPDVTAVGGTSLSTGQSYYGGETAWSGGSPGCSQNDGGSGGGCSTYFSTPGYQGGGVCSGQKRSVPDIALNSDWVDTPQYLFLNGQWYDSGGTSIASPEMAGFLAQENAYLLYIQSLVGNTCGPNLAAPCSPMGEANPYLYNEFIHPFAPHYPFYDITSGCNNNDITQRYGLQYFCAGPGYDLVTGVGSANMLQLAWTINSFLAGDGAGPTASITGPPVNHWYNTDQSVSWTLTDNNGNGHRPNGPAGASLAWDADPGDPYSAPTPGGGNSYYGPQFYGASGSGGGLGNLGVACHYAYVRGWDNAGNSALSTYGPLCFDNIPPVVTITLTGNQLPNGNYSGPVLVSISATDNASGVTSLTYSVNGGNDRTYTAPFYEYLPGYYGVNATAVDGAGNNGYGVSAFDLETNQQFAVTISKPGTGAGTVISSDGSINCGSTCSANYYDEQPVTLTATPAPGSVFIGWRNCDLSYGLRCTLTVTAARPVSAIFNVPVALQFVPVTPCRVVDTRWANGAFGGPIVPGGTERDFPIPNSPNLATCGDTIPANAAAYSLNATVVPRGRLGYLTTWPTGLTQPVISTLNSLDGRVKANALIVPAGDNAAVSAYVTDTSDVILDIDGYFVPASGSTLAFFPLTPCRVVDTRPGNQNYPGLGPPALTAQAARELPILNASPCFAQLPPGVIPAAYSFNVTVVPNPAGQWLGYVTLWPSDRQQPVVSTLNNLTATVVANAAIVPADPTGEVSVYAYNSTDLILDVNGYFAAPSMAPNPLSFYVFAPCRALDTRHGVGAFTGELTVPVANSPCQLPTAAKGYVLSATVVPTISLGYLTLWPDGQTLPIVSTLNAVDGTLTSNMAIVAPSNDGSVDAYAADGWTQLILDISSYLAP